MTTDLQELLNKLEDFSSYENDTYMLFISKDKQCVMCYITDKKKDNIYCLSLGSNELKELRDYIGVDCLLSNIYIDILLESIINFNFIFESNNIFELLLDFKEIKLNGCLHFEEINNPLFLKQLKSMSSIITKIKKPIKYILEDLKILKEPMDTTQIQNIDDFKIKYSKVKPIKSVNIRERKRKTNPSKLE